MAYFIYQVAKSNRSIKTVEDFMKAHQLNSANFNHKVNFLWYFFSLQCLLYLFIFY